MVNLDPNNNVGNLLYDMSIEKLAHRKGTHIIFMLYFMFIKKIKILFIVY